MSPIIQYIPKLSAELLAIAMVQHAPDVQHERFVFDGVDVGALAGEDVIVTYERKPKVTTLQFVELVQPEMVEK